LQEGSGLEKVCELLENKDPKVLSESEKGVSNYSKAINMKGTKEGKRIQGGRAGSNGQMGQVDECHHVHGERCGRCG
jgi:hypothetical protein